MPLLELYGKNPDGAIDKRVIAGMTGWIIFFPTDTPPDGTLVCNGAELSTSAYPELYGAIGTKYGGNGTATFRLPKAEDVIYAAGARHAVGEAVSEGLPDITGTIASRSYTVSDGTMIWACDPGSAFFDCPVIYEGDGSHVAGVSGALDTIELDFLPLNLTPSTGPAPTSLPPESPCCLASSIYDKEIKQ